MKSASTFFFMVLMLIQSGGLVLVSLPLLLEHQYAVAQKLRQPGTELRTIHLSYQHFRECKYDRNEIILNGCLYDIRSISCLNNYVEVIAYRDDGEELLLSLIEKNFGDTGKDSIPAAVVKLLSAVYVMPDPGLAFHASATAKCFCFAGPGSYQSVPGESGSPPPEPAI